ncbi:hypothetical protein QHH03_31310, partial [Aphanizomenon sp. 202]|nr:hypothetical protein [Aphanizomenon sp. 202]
ALAVVLVVVVLCRKIGIGRNGGVLRAFLHDGRPRVLLALVSTRGFEDNHVISGDAVFGDGFNGGFVFINVFMGRVVFTGVSIAVFAASA